MSCFICDETFNHKTHSAVVCPYCSFTACRTCCEKYLLDKTVATCMQNDCDKEWTRKFMVEAFTGKFVAGPWKLHRERILYEREKALMPATQGIVEEQIEKEKKQKEMAELDALIRTMYERRRNLSAEIAMGGDVKVRKQFIRACPGECRGFLSTAWKCGLCEQWTCPDCHVLKGPDHACHADDLATAKLLDSDTKPCPKCATGIFKIEGCDQMWCTQCHTAFSWRTGHIETRIHNPHYYEWQRRNGGAPRVVGDVQCGRELTHQTATDIARSINAQRGAQVVVFEQLKEHVNDVVQGTIHLHAVQMRSYQVDPVENNVALRIAYLRQRIGDEDFKVRLQRSNKLHEKKREMHEILMLFVETVTEIVYRLKVALEQTGKRTEQLRHTTEQVRHIIQTHLTEVEGIRQYTNECLADIAGTYNNKLKYIRVFSSENDLREVLL